ncbi:MAG: signal peptide peptidase SppA, partial [Fusobacterium periodonticum]|nr:signal peptide peptidase SppA [Fusobacterium periodonticum]
CIDSLAKDLELKDFKLAYIRGRQSIAEIVSAMKPQFIKSDIVEKMEMLKSYSNKILYYDESLENL